MNYFELHIGDYAEATAHLTFTEDAAYMRLLRKYYAQEKPLPADVKAVQRLIGARTKEEKNAVASVLEEFFFLTDDGWHNSRCDAEIDKFISGEPEREVKKANEKNRLAQHRAERQALFKQVTDAGHHLPWNVSIKELREFASNLQRLPETKIPIPETQPATAPATPATATQTPVPNTHTPIPNKELRACIDDSQVVGPGQQVERATPVDLCKVMRSHGIEAQPADPRIIALAEQGATCSEVEYACIKAKTTLPAGQRIKAGYVIGTVTGLANDAAKVRAQGATPSGQTHKTAAQQKLEATQACARAIGLGGGGNDWQPGNVIDMGEADQVREIGQ